MLDLQTADGICFVRLNAPPLNTLSTELLQQLCTAVSQANADPSVRGMVLTGRDDHFSAGADIHLFQEIRSCEDAVGICRVFQSAFRQLEDSSKPVVAAVAGSVLGGALEMVLACHFRVAAEGTRFSLPEVRLGINPGAGGTQRLPRLIGVRAALQMLLTAQSVPAPQALELGLVDAVCAPDQLLEVATDLLATGKPQKTSDRFDRLGDVGQREADLAEGKDRWLHDTRPEIIAPQKIFEAVRTGVLNSIDEGLEQEQQAFAECMETLAAQNKIRLFFATRQVNKIPELAGIQGPDISRAAVVGMGTMGTGIVHALVASGILVVALDEDASKLERGKAKIVSSLEKRVEQGKLAGERAESMRNMISLTTAWTDLAGSPLVIESVFEDVQVKRSVLANIEDVCDAETILASNTSTLSLDELAAELRRPERLIGMHFFNPAQRMPLVEIIRREVTVPAALVSALQLAKRMRKTPVVVRNREGFLVSRLFVPYLQEAFQLVQEGAAPEAVDKAALEYGFPMGPLVLIDMAGLDILVHTQRVLRRAFPRHGALSPIAVRLVEQGLLGQKAGAGVYCYEAGSHAPHPSGRTAEITRAVQHESGDVPRPIEGREIAERLVLRMVSEAYCVLEEGIVRSPADVDVAMVLGIGFPDFRGGVFKYAQDLGLNHVRSRLDDLAARCGERFAPCRLLRETEGVE